MDTCSDPSKWTSVGPHGRQGGCSWDDGVHTTVRRLIIHSIDVIEGIQIEYDDNGESKLSDIHGREKGTRRTVSYYCCFKFKILLPQLAPEKAHHFVDIEKTCSFFFVNLTLVG